MSPSIALTNGVVMPRIGMGVYKVSPEDAYAAVSAGITAGLRLIDTAEYYANEDAVGAAIERSEVPREELFVTTKLWNNHHAMTTAGACASVSNPPTT